MAPRPVQPAAPEPTDAQALQAVLAALRAEGGQRLDPVRFRYLESLCGRMAGASPAVRRILNERASLALDAYRSRLGPAPAVAVAPAPTGPVRPFASVYAQRRAVAAGVRPVSAAGRPASEAPLAPLAALNRYIHQTARQGASAVTVPTTAAVNTVHDVAAPGTAGALTSVAMEAASANRGELKSARRFSETWSKLQSETLVEQALQRSPENAGPFNPHMLMVRSLALMRELSPDYLHRFMQHADVLLWLEQATSRHQPAAGKPKPTKPARARK